MIVAAVLNRAIHIPLSDIRIDPTKNLSEILEVFKTKTPKEKHSSAIISGIRR